MMLYEDPSPILHCIRLLGENIAGQGYGAVKQLRNIFWGDFCPPPLPPHNAHSVSHPLTPPLLALRDC